MPSAKKAAEKRPKKEKAPAPPSDDSDDDGPEEEEEEEVESEHVRRKRERGRLAFLKLLRRGAALIPLAIVLSRQEFMKRPRGAGVNAAKVKPLDFALTGAVHFAAGSPTFMRNPKLHTYLNATGVALLTPGEYILAQQSKRAMPAEKTIAGAYKKAEKAFSRLVDRDKALIELVTAPQPNLLLIGSGLILAGVLLCPFIGGLFEYVTVVGCVVLMQGGRQLGMEAEPELYVAGGVAVLAIMAMEAMGKKSPPPKAKRR